MNCKISLDEIEKKIRNFKSELACNSQKIRRKWIKFGISLRQHGLKSSKSADNYWLKQLSRLDVMIQLNSPSSAPLLVFLKLRLHHYQLPW